MDAKTIWETPELTVFGTVENITDSVGPPTKKIGGGDGAVWQSQAVTWVSNGPA